MWSENIHFIQIEKIWSTFLQKRWTNLRENVKI